MDPIMNGRTLQHAYIVSYWGAMGLLVMAAMGDPTSRAVVAWLTRQL